VRGFFFFLLVTSEMRSGAARSSERMERAGSHCRCRGGFYELVVKLDQLAGSPKRGLRAGLHYIVATSDPDDHRLAARFGLK
jgi:hypothetical protein